MIREQIKKVFILNVVKNRISINESPQLEKKTYLKWLAPLISWF